MARVKQKPAETRNGKSQKQQEPDTRNRWTRLQAEVAAVGRQLERLSAAVTAGGGLTALLSAIRARERRRAEAAEGLRIAEGLTRTTRIDTKRLERELMTELRDWRGLLAEDVSDPRRGRLYSGFLWDAWRSGRSKLASTRRANSPEWRR